MNGGDRTQNGCSDDILLPCAGAFALLVCVVCMLIFGGIGEGVTPDNICLPCAISALW